MRRRSLIAGRARRNVEDTITPRPLSPVAAALLAMVRAELCTLCRMELRVEGGRTCALCAS